MSKLRARCWLPLVWLVAACASEPVGASEAKPKADHDALELSVLSYNVNFGLGGDPEGVAAILDAGTDIVLLQETTPEWEAALRGSEPVNAAWPHMHFHHCCGAGASRSCHAGRSPSSRSSSRRLAPMLGSRPPMP